jgi:hypothetical protein
MKTSTEDQVKGKFHEVKGDLKERAARDPSADATSAWLH